jgi:hypothetical protein
MGLLDSPPPVPSVPVEPPCALLPPLTHSFTFVPNVSGCGESNTIECWRRVGHGCWNVEPQVPDDRPTRLPLPYAPRNLIAAIDVYGGLAAADADEDLVTMALLQPTPIGTTILSKRRSGCIATSWLVTASAIPRPPRTQPAWRNCERRLDLRD